MTGKYTEPDYRVDFYATDAKHDQMVINFFRRLIGLPIRKTPQEAEDMVRRRFLRADAD